MNKDYKFIKDAYEGKHGSICQEWKDTILKHYPEFKEAIFEKGWYKSKLSKCFAFVDGLVHDGDFVGFGFLDTGKWIELTDGWASHFYTHWTKATKEEILSYLSKEADKRGYRPGVSIVSLGESWESEHCKGKEAEISENINFDYDYSLDILWVDVVYPNGKHNNLIIYEKGQWAEKIQTITKEEAEKKLGMKII